MFIFLGLIIALGTSFWWHAEVTGRIGDSANYVDTSTCLFKIGSGDCQALWFVGLHQENLVAGSIFWIGVVLFAIGIWHSVLNPRKD